MCKCTPEMKTPFCGKPGCEWPAQEPLAVCINDDDIASLGERLPRLADDLAAMDLEDSALTVRQAAMAVRLIVCPLDGIDENLVPADLENAAQNLEAGGFSRSSNAMRQAIVVFREKNRKIKKLNREIAILSDREFVDHEGNQVVTSNAAFQEIVFLRERIRVHENERDTAKYERDQLKHELRVIAERNEEKATREDGNWLYLVWENNAGDTHLPVWCNMDQMSRVRPLHMGDRTKTILSLPHGKEITVLDELVRIDGKWRIAVKSQ